MEKLNFTNRGIDNFRSRSTPTQSKTSSSPKLLFILLSLVLSVGIYIVRTNGSLFDHNAKKEAINKEEEQKTGKDQQANDEEPIVEDTTFSYENSPVTTDGHFFELLPVIEGQQAYVAHPIKIDTQKPPTIIIYSHGSNTTVTTNFDDQFMLDMRAYGEFFTKEGYIFAASNQHGANWGSQQAIDDTVNLINWVEASYQTEPKVNLLGFSMGGLPTFTYAFQNATKINKIALLAPTTRPESWTKTQILTLQDIPIKIWHGDKDVNVGWWLSNMFVETAAGYGKQVEFVTVTGKAHFDLDTELMPELLEYYTEAEGG